MLQRARIRSPRRTDQHHHGSGPHDDHPQYGLRGAAMRPAGKHQHPASPGRLVSLPPRHHVWRRAVVDAVRMSARLTVTGDLRGEPWLRFTPTIGGEAAEMDKMVETVAGDVEVALGITLLT